jgi:hypothetical protein
VAATRKRRGEPHFNNFEGQVLWDHSLAEREHVAVIVLAGKPRRLETPAQSAADPSNLIRHNSFSISGAAQNDAAFTLPTRDRFGRRPYEQWIIDRLRAGRAEILVLVPEALQDALDFFFVLESSVVGSKCDFQQRENMVREIVLSSGRKSLFIFQEPELSELSVMRCRGLPESHPPVAFFLSTGARFEAWKRRSR